LKINIELNNVKNIRPTHLALAGERGETLLHHDDGNWGHSIMRSFSMLSAAGNHFSLGAEKVASDTLAGFMIERGITRLNFIKFNCEGAEFPIILHTSLDVLARIDKMLILYHLDLAHDYSLDALIDYLNIAGFDTELRYQSQARGWVIANRNSKSSVD
jgi:FkbM family methyltransferase